MRLFIMLPFFPVYLLMFLMDVGIFFLSVRLLVRFWPARPLVYLDRFGSTAVESVTDAVSRRLGHLARRPLSRRQEEALALLVLSIARLVLGEIMVRL